MNCRTIIVVAAFLFCIRRSDAVSVAGQQVRPGGKLEIQFPVASYYQDYAAQGGNPRPITGRALLYFPRQFNANGSCPILIITSTTDNGRTSPQDAPWYADAAMAEGWMVLAPDFTVRPKSDSVSWRLAMLGAALNVIHKEWPQSTKCSVAFAGLSGGAKLSALLGGLLAKTETVNVRGFFLSGMNDDRMSLAYNEFRPPRQFLDVPVWISSGSDDHIAPPQIQQAVYFSMQRTGFHHVRLEGFFGRHQVNPGEVQRALRWFREVGRF